MMDNIENDYDELVWKAYKSGLVSDQTILKHFKINIEEEIKQKQEEQKLLKNPMDEPVFLEKYPGTFTDKELSQCMEFLEFSGSLPPKNLSPKKENDPLKVYKVGDVVYLSKYPKDPDSTTVVKGTSQIGKEMQTAWQAAQKELSDNIENGTLLGDPTPENEKEKFKKVKWVEDIMSDDKFRFIDVD